MAGAEYPEQLVVSIGEGDLLQRAASTGRYQGLYIQGPMGYPMWINENHSRWLYKGTDGSWYIGDAEEHELNFECSRGYFKSIDQSCCKSYSTKSPHECKWQRWDDECGQWIQVTAMVSCVSQQRLVWPRRNRNECPEHLYVLDVSDSYKTSELSGKYDRIEGTEDDESPSWKHSVRQFGIRISNFNAWIICAQQRSVDDFRNDGMLVSWELASEMLPHEVESWGRIGDVSGEWDYSVTYVSSESIACAWQQLKKDIQTAAESQNAGGENIPAKAGGRLGMLQEVRAHEGAQEIDQQPEVLAAASQ